MSAEKFEVVLKEKKIEAILVSDGYNMRYLSGFAGATGYLLLTGDKKILMTDGRYTTQARNESPDFTVMQVSAGREYGKMVASILEENGIQSVGFEDQHMRYAAFMEMKEENSTVNWVPLGSSLSDLRIIKTEAEIESTAKAEEIGSRAFEYILGVLKPGMTELEVAVELEGYMKRNGASGLSFDTIIASGINSALPHAVPGEKKLETGDFVTMDFGCVYQGYCSDMTRTVVLGKASDKQKEIYSVVLESQLAAIDGIRADMRGCDVDKIARDVITKAGYGEYFGHGLGHATGLEIHEEPRFSPVCDAIVRENTLMTVEPGIYLPDFGGVRIEDLGVVKKDGYQNLTSAPKQLIEL